MIDRFGRERGIEFEQAKAEYLKLGLEKKQLTRAAIAEKFDIDPQSISGIAQIEIEDFHLIRALLEERKNIAVKRKHIRDIYFL